MNRKSLKALTLLAVSLLLPAMALPQGLAEAARAEQARRKKTSPASPAKVYSESDLPASSTVQISAESDDAKSNAAAAGSPSGKNEAASRPGSEEAKAQEAAVWKSRVAEVRERVAGSEALVKRLGNHPTGGGKVCRIPEGVFQPGVTAPEQVVCPYQMESKYDAAKRTLEKRKAELAAVLEAARRAGVVL